MQLLKLRHPLVQVHAILILSLTGFPVENRCPVLSINKNYSYEKTTLLNGTGAAGIAGIQTG